MARVQRPQDLVGATHLVNTKSDRVCDAVKVVDDSENVRGVGGRVRDLYFEEIGRAHV